MYAGRISLVTRCIPANPDRWPYTGNVVAADGLEEPLVLLAASAHTPTLTIANAYLVAPQPPKLPLRRQRLPLLSSPQAPAVPSQAPLALLAVPTTRLHSPSTAAPTHGAVATVTWLQQHAASTLM